MKVLINLFSFVGGGETIMCNYCDYLNSQNEKFIFICKKNSYIDKYCSNRNYKVIYWPFDYDEFNKINREDHNKFEKFTKELNKIFQSHNSNFITNNLRDFYNLCKILRFMKVLNFKCLHLIHHPEDSYYLDNWNFLSNDIKNKNEKNLKYLNSFNSILFNNDLCKKNLIGEEDSKNEYINLPASSATFHENKNGIEEKIKIICISRFVIFKVGSVIKLLHHVKNNSNLELTIVGYGKFGYLIRFWIFLLGISKQVKLLGKIEPNSLEKIIKKHDIGYAQGMALMEIVRNGIPCIIAPYSKIIEIFLNNEKTGGIFGEDKPWLGDYSRGQDYLYESSFDDDFKKIKASFNEVKVNSKSGFKLFSPDTVFPEITNYLNNVKVIHLDKIDLPKIPTIKLLLSKNLRQ